MSPSAIATQPNIQLPVALAEELHLVSQRLLSSLDTPVEIKAIFERLQGAVETGCRSLLNQLTICRDLIPDMTFTFDEPHVIASDDGSFSVLVPGRGTPMSILNIALATLAEYGIAIDTTDPDLDAEVNPATNVRLHSCSNPDHAFHPEFGVSSDVPGSALVTRVNFSNSGR